MQAAGRLQVRSENPPATLQPTEWQSIPRALQQDMPAAADDVPGLLTDRWLADVSLFGTATMVRDRVAEWRDAGVSTPIIVPSSAAGNQLKAIEEMFATFG